TLSGYLSLKFLCQDRFWNCAYLLVDDLPVLEHKEGRDVTDAIPGGNIRIFIHVEFCNYGLALVFASQFFHQRTDHLTRTAPFGPKIDQNWFVRVYDLIKIRVV